MAFLVTSDTPANVTPIPIEEEHFCKWVLYVEISHSRVRIWDLAILIPNLFFFLFLLARVNRARLKLRATSSPIFATFYALILINVCISIIRCVVSMTVNASESAGDYVDKILWVCVRFFLLFTEMSVVIFGLAFGHLDSRSSIRYVLLATSCISLAFSISQGVSEFVSPDETFYIVSKEYALFAHGGMIFWFISSIVFSVVYLGIFSLRWTPVREVLALPTKLSFYYYIAYLILLNALQSIGSGLLYYHTSAAGLCMVDLTTYLYYTLFTPFAYYTFLAEFFSVSQPSILFSYKSQVDDTAESDNVSLPHQSSFTSLKTDSDCIYQTNSLYDSTHFYSLATPRHPLYAVSLQSPDSITSYSVNNVPFVGYQQGSESQD